MNKTNAAKSEKTSLLDIKVVPGASKTQLAGSLGDKLKIRVSAAPEKGKANEALIKFLANKLGLKKNCIKIISGLSSEFKQLEITGISRAELMSKLSPEKNGHNG